MASPVTKRRAPGECTWSVYLREKQRSQLGEGDSCDPSFTSCNYATWRGWGWALTGPNRCLPPVHYSKGFLINFRFRNTEDIAHDFNRFWARHTIFSKLFQVDMHFSHSVYDLVLGRYRVLRYRTKNNCEFTSDACILTAGNQEISYFDWEQFAIFTGMPFRRVTASMLSTRISIIK